MTTFAQRNLPQRVNMEKGIQVTTQTVVTAEMSLKWAEQLTASLTRALTLLENHVTLDQRNYLVNTGTIDDLVALRTAIQTAQET